MKKSQSSPPKTYKTVKLHWRPLNNIVSQATMWNQLPSVTIDNEEFKRLFEKKEYSSKKTSVFTEKPKELNILENKRSMQIEESFMRT